mgnify:CR=1 FL=1
MRRDAVEGLFQTLMQYRHALAGTLSGQIRFNVFLARSRGYDTAFIYGGYGYFDNMNYFFGNNGYRVVNLGIKVPVDQILEVERLGYDSVWSAEAYGSDAVTPSMTAEITSEFDSIGSILIAPGTAAPPREDICARARSTLSS